MTFELFTLSLKLQKSESKIYLNVRVVKMLSDLWFGTPELDGIRKKNLLLHNLHCPFQLFFI